MMQREKKIKREIREPKLDSSVYVPIKKQLFSRVRTIIRIKKIIAKKVLTIN